MCEGHERRKDEGRLRAGNEEEEMWKRRSREENRKEYIKQMREGDKTARLVFCIQYVE